MARLCLSLSLIQIQTLLRSIISVMKILKKKERSRGRRRVREGLPVTASAKINIGHLEDEFLNTKDPRMTNAIDQDGRIFKQSAEV